MTEPTSIDLAGVDGTTLAGYRWDPTDEPKAVAQIAHGVGEHALRYGRVADAFTAAGYVVYSHDHRAHGASVESPEQYGILGDEGWGKLVADIGAVGRQAAEQHPGLPVVLVAHSLGSFAAQQLLLDHSDQYAAVVLSGTAAIDLLEPAMDLDAPMDLSAFNAPFAPARTDFDWLSRDDAEVDAYIADPACGFGLDAAGMKATFVGARQLADPTRVAAMRHDLPVYVTVGALDPVNGNLALAHVLVDRYRAAGLDDVTLRAWDDARHEVFNETNRREVVDEMIAWLDQRVAR